MVNQSRYLVVVYVVTAGLHDDDLGSDEEEIILFAWLVIDTVTQKVFLETNWQYVKPQKKDANDNILSEVVRDSYNISEEQIKNAMSLSDVLCQLDAYINTHLSNESFCLVTDGQLHLRQVLHPEAMKKSIVLPSYFYQFYDLRKEFRKFYRNNDMKTVEDMLNYLTIKSDISDQFVERKIQNVATIINRLISDGHQFEEFQTISSKLEPGICSKNEFIDHNTVVRARGLPWQSSDQDIANFFIGLDIVKGGVALCLCVQGRRNGEALIRFVNQEHRDMALRRHKHHIGQRYIEVYRATGDDFLNVAGGNNNEAQAFLSRGGQAIIRMRGLPYDCTAQQVIDFFATGECCDVMDGDEGVLFVRKPDGRPTGDAFAMFATEEIGAKALQKHRESIGSRYIELFRSTTAEVQQVFNRSMDLRVYESAMAQSILPTLVTQPLLRAGSRKDCIKLRGLPYGAHVEQILEFLGEHSKNIVFQGVHMVYNAQGQPSGEAFIQMDSEQSAAAVTKQRHHHYMVCGKKQRYIEVFQCSVEDMNLTGINLQRPLLSSNGTLLPPPPFATPFPFQHVAHSTHAAPGATVHQPHHHPTPVLPVNGTAPAVTLSVTQAAHSAATARIPAAFGPFNPNPFNLIYWPYPSPPVSPTAYFAATHHTPAPAMVNMRGLR